MASLGSRTSASVREDEQAQWLIAELTGLGSRIVRQRLQAAPGNTLVCNLFGAWWPSSQERLLTVRVKLARDAALFEEISAVTDLSTHEVKGLLEEAHGRTLVGNLFGGDWRSSAGAATYDDESSDSDEDASEQEEEDEDGDEEPSGSSERRAPRALTCHPDGAWSRPRGLRSVISALGMEVPERLRTTRYHEVVSALGKLGIEMCLVDEDHPQTIFHDSPGIGRKVRLRARPADDSEDLEEEDEEDEDVEEEDEEDEDVEEEDEDPDEDDDEDDVAADDESSDEDSESDIGARLHLDSRGAWSKSRGLPRLLTVLGMDVPQRLRTERFRVLMLELDRLGLQARLASDLRVLTPDDDSPGIGAAIHLRIAPTDARSPARSAPMTPIVVVPGPRPSGQVTSTPQESQYELALLRLQFLTAVPTMERAYQSEWPGEFVSAAVQGLHLSDDERRHLTVVSRQWERGNHSPFSAAAPIVRNAAHHDLPGLVEALRRLNAHFPDAVEHVVSIVEDQFQRTFSRPLFGVPHTGRATPRPPPPKTGPPAPAPAPAPVSAGKTVPFAASPPSSGANVRDLGSLGGMFDD